MSAQVVEAYWMPGCTSCLRMKEFLEASGVPFVAINLDGNPEAQAKLKALGLLAPVTCIGERGVNGMDLAAVAELVGVEYRPRAMLTPAELVERYEVNQQAGCRFLAQMTPQALAYQIDGRARPMLEVAYQVGMVARSFLKAYYDDRHTTRFYSLPQDVRTKEQILEAATETRARMRKWWDEEGQDDPLDRVTKTYWGHATLHEVLEREVWHTTQHARQLMDVLQRHGIAPDGPLTPAHLDGLPLPERIHD
ncbi:MAG: glutaredoxin domain-containing protein [Phenylobacterium sp.]